MPAEDDAQGVRAGFERPFPGGAPQAVVAVQHGRRRHRIGRMQIDHGTQRLRPLPERIERRVIKILPVGVAVDHGAAEFELAHAALEFSRPRRRHPASAGGETGIAVGPLRDFARQEFVRRARIADRALPCRARPAHRGRRWRERSARCPPDPWLASRISPKSFKRAKNSSRFFGRQIRDRGRPVIFQPGGQAMLLKRNLARHAAPCRSLALFFCTAFWSKRINA